MGKGLGPPRPIAEEPLYRRVGWLPHGGQQRVIHARHGSGVGPPRTRTVAAGRRFGKSEIGGHKLVAEAMDTRLVKSELLDASRQRIFWIVGPSYSDSEKEFRVMWNRLTKMGMREYFDRPGSYNNPLLGDMHLSLWDGTFQVHAKSERHPESLVGEGLSGVILAEAAKLKERTYTKLIRPTLADFEGWLLSTSTPEGKNWWYQHWKRGQDPAFPEWWSMRAPSWLNPYVYPQGASDAGIQRLRQAIAEHRVADRGLFAECGVDPEIGDLVVDLTEEAFNQEIGAEFSEFVGRVFKDFDEEVHVGDLTYDPSWRTYGAVDYGFRNPNVWLLVQVDPFGERVNVLDEVYEQGLTADDFAGEIQRRGLCPGGTLAFYPDPASPGDTAVLEERLRVKHKGGTGGEIRWRVDAIRRALKPVFPHLPSDAPGQRPSLMFDRRCEKTINDMGAYRYAEKKAQQQGNGPENPMKVDDHGPEALGRLYAGLFGTPDKIARKARQRRAGISR